MPRRDRSVPTSAGSLRVIDTGGPGGGDGTAFLFLHGNLSRGDHFRPQLDALGDVARCLAPDQRGFGASPLEPPPTSALAMARDAADVCAALGVTRAHVVGLSLGGIVAQALATTHPELVATLTLASTYRIDDPHPHIAPMLAGTAGSVPDPATIGPMLQAASFSRAFLAEHADVARRIGDELASTAHASFQATVQVHGEAARVVAPAIAAPTLVLGAAEDRTAPPEVTRHLADAVPGARYELLPCGHLMNVELPERFTELIRSHAGV